MNFDLTEEQQILQRTVREFARERVAPLAEELDREHRYPAELIAEMAEMGLMGVAIPEEYGGAGLDATAAAQVSEILSSSDPGFALACLAHSVLFAQNVAVNGGMTVA